VITITPTYKQNRGPHTAPFYTVKREQLGCFSFKLFQFYFNGSCFTPLRLWDKEKITVTQLKAQKRRCSFSSDRWKHRVKWVL